MSAAGALLAPADTLRLLPEGQPMKNGRVTLFPPQLARTGPRPWVVTVPLWFAWVGPQDRQPTFLAEVQEAHGSILSRGRLSVPLYARGALGVPTPNDFAVVVSRFCDDGLLLVPTHDYLRRIEGVRELVSPAR